MNNIKNTQALTNIYEQKLQNQKAELLDAIIRILKDVIFIEVIQIQIIFFLIRKIKLKKISWHL